MEKPLRRNYDASRRRLQAEATRQAILQAARTLFAQQGYQATTLQAIAQQASIAVQTLYAVFGSKAAILSALVQSAGADEAIRALARTAMAETDPKSQLRQTAHVIRAILEKEAVILDLLWQAGSGDPDLAAVWRQSHRQQLARQREVMNLLAQKGALKPRLTIETATHIHWALSSPEVYRLLVSEQGWTPQQFEDWLAESAITLLLDDF